MGLQGPPGVWLFLYPEEEVETWDKLKEGLLMTFGNRGPTSHRMANFLHCKQEPNQSVSDFATTLRCNSMNLTMSNQVLMSTFLNGLKEPIASAMLREDPKDFQDAVNAAHKYESIPISSTVFTLTSP